MSTLYGMVHIKTINIRTSIKLMLPDKKQVYLLENAKLFHVNVMPLITVKTIYKGHSREPESVVFMSSNSLYTG